MTQPLAGVRVLDLSARTGAYCGKILADLGADVIKVELPSGDKMRFRPPFRDGPRGPESSALFAYYHHNKRGITLNWERDDAGVLLESLGASADVVLASPKGEPERLTGLVEDPPSLTWVPDSVLTCFITPFGLTGPYRDLAGHPLHFVCHERLHACRGCSGGTTSGHARATVLRRSGDLGCVPGPGDVAGSTSSVGSGDRSFRARGRASSTSWGRSSTAWLATSSHGRPISDRRPEVSGGVVTGSWTSGRTRPTIGISSSTCWVGRMS